LRYGIAGAWALDLFLGRVTRSHGDVSVAVLQRDLDALRVALPGWTWPNVVDPGAAVLSATAPDGTTRLVFLPHDAVGDVWIYRNDPRVTLALRQTFLRSSVGVPFLAPEIVLLLRSEEPPTGDTNDGDAVLPHLGARRSAWLHEALRLARPDSATGRSA
jgi:hypothetical protein